MAGNLYPANSRLDQKIEAAAALRMAVGRAMVDDEDQRASTGSFRIQLHSDVPPSRKLRTGRTRVAQRPIWPQHQSGDEHKTGHHGAEPSADTGIEIAFRQALHKANDHGAADRSDNAIEPSDVADREDLEADQHRANAAAGNDRPGQDEVALDAPRPSEVMIMATSGRSVIHRSTTRPNTSAIRAKMAPRGPPFYQQRDEEQHHLSVSLALVQRKSWSPSSLLT